MKIFIKCTAYVEDEHLFLPVFIDIVYIVAVSGYIGNNKKSVITLTTGDEIHVNGEPEEIINKIKELEK